MGTPRTNDSCPAPAYYGVVPANVRYDKRLRPNAKLLYCEISALANAKGYCWANNAYFAELYGLSKKTISELIAQLERCGHLSVEVVRDEGGQVIERRLWIDNFVRNAYTADEPEPEPENSDETTPSPEKSGYPSPEKSGYPPPKNVKENNTSYLNTPLPPTGDACAECDEDDEPSIEEKFAAFWGAYPKCPRKVDRKKAFKVFRKINPSAALLRAMLTGLSQWKRCRQWTKDNGEFIPMPATWLNGERWETPPCEDVTPTGGGGVVEDGELRW